MVVAEKQRTFPGNLEVLLRGPEYDREMPVEEIGMYAAKEFARIFRPQDRGGEIRTFTAEEIAGELVKAGVYETVKQAIADVPTIVSTELRGIGVSYPWEKQKNPATGALTYRLRDDDDSDYCP